MGIEAEQFGGIKDFSEDFVMHPQDIGKEAAVQMSRQVSELSEEEKNLRLRRKAFYLQNGMKPMDFLVELFGVEMEILVYGASVTFEEYYSILESTVPPHLIHHVRLLGAIR